MASTDARRFSQWPWKVLENQPYTATAVKQVKHFSHPTQSHPLCARDIYLNEVDSHIGQPIFIKPITGYIYCRPFLPRFIGTVIDVERFTQVKRQPATIVYNCTLDSGYLRGLGRNRLETMLLVRWIAKAHTLPEVPTRYDSIGRKHRFLITHRPQSSQVRAFAGSVCVRTVV